MNMLLKGTLFMITLERLLNVTIYLGVFLLFISFITFVIKRGPDLLFFSIWNFFIFWSSNYNWNKIFS